MSAKNSLPQQAPQDQLQSTLLTIVIRGEVHEYLYTRITNHCHVLTSLKTGATRQYHSVDNLWAFFAELINHLNKQTKPTEPKQLPQPKIAGLLPPYAGLVPGQCRGWLNAHWSPLATDGWVMRGQDYCPHCYVSYRVAMDYMMAQRPAA